MKPEYASKKPPVLFTYDESCCYFAVNPERVTALELMGEASSEFFSIYQEAVRKNDGTLCLPDKEFFTNCSFFELREFPGLVLELGPEGIFQIQNKKRVGVLKENNNGFLYWESTDGKSSIPASRVVYLCRQIEMKLAT